MGAVFVAGTARPMETAVVDETPELTIIPASEGDVPLILEMILGLADNLGLAHEVAATEEDLREALFGERPKAEVVLARRDGEPVGFALFYDVYSTFRGHCGLHLEDLYVHPESRGAGVGRRLLAYLARLALARGCGRLEWWVLSDDERAQAFYEMAGAMAKDEWTIFRLRGEELIALAAEAGADPLKPLPD